MLTRVANLEKENVELQEQVLALKKQIMQLKTAGHSRPSTPQATSHAEVESLQTVVDSLKAQVIRAVTELRAYRDSHDVEQMSSPRWSIESNAANSHISNLTSLGHTAKDNETKNAHGPPVPTRSASDDFDKLLDASLQDSPHQPVENKVHSKNESRNLKTHQDTFDLDDLLN